MTKTANNSLTNRKNEVAQQNKPVNMLKGLLKENQKQLKATLGDNASGFMVSLVNLYTQDLKEADPMTVMNSAFIAAALKLPIEKNLGFAYIVPFKNNNKGTMEAQFQLGYRGLIQLALRSGGVKKLNAIEVREGQIEKFNPLTEEIEFNFSDEHSKNEVVGYAAYLELVNGFSKTIYLSAKQMEEHAAKFSQSYKTDLKYKNKKSIWSTMFDVMAKKTMIKKILKFAPLSTDMQIVETIDQSSIRNVDLDENGKIDLGSLEAEFVDNNETTATKDAEIVEEVTTEEIKQLLEFGKPFDKDVTAESKKRFKTVKLDKLSREQFEELKTWVEEV